MYPIQLTQPMANELNEVGFTSLHTPETVASALENQEGTTLLVVNSVCGCAAAYARPGVKIALSDDKRPDNLVTVFAGVDVDAVRTARTYLAPYPPSSPSIALFKDGKLVHFIERHNIEGRSAEMIANNHKNAFATYC